MKDKLLFGTIGLLVGIVVMQWTMPLGQANVATTPAGNIFAHVSSHLVVGTDGRYWNFNLSTETWDLIDGVEAIPIPLADVWFIQPNAFVDKAGNYWEHSSEPYWINRGQLPIGPVATSPSTIGGVKSKYR